MAKLSDLPTTFLEGVLVGDRNAASFSFTVNGHAALRSEVAAEIERRKAPVVEPQYVQPPIVVPDPESFMSEEEMLGLKSAIRHAQVPCATVDSNGRKVNV